MQSYLQLAYQLATRNSQLATRNLTRNSQLARLTYFSYSISSPIRRISFQKSLFKKIMVCILVRVPHRVPLWAPMRGTPGFTATRFTSGSEDFINFSRASVAPGVRKSWWMK